MSYVGNKPADEERMASVTTLEGLRQAVKTKYPK